MTNKYKSQFYSVLSLNNITLLKTNTRSIYLNHYCGQFAHFHYFEELYV